MPIKSLRAVSYTHLDVYKRQVQKGSTVEYCYDDAALPAAIRRVGRGYTLQRYKGLGEMNPEQLWETTMNPQGRKLMQVTLDDLAEACLLYTSRCV